MPSCMVTVDIMDSMHFRKNPWRNTSYGKGDLVLASDPSGGTSSQQRQAQQRLASASQDASSECSSLQGMARNRCRIEYVADNV